MQKDREGNFDPRNSRKVGGNWGRRRGNGRYAKSSASFASEGVARIWVMAGRVTGKRRGGVELESSRWYGADAGRSKNARGGSGRLGCRVRRCERWRQGRARRGRIGNLGS